MDRLSSFVLSHRRSIFAFWLVAFLAGGVASGQVSKRLSYDFSLPGQSGYESAQKLIKAYDGATDQLAYVPVVTVPAGQTVAGSAAEVKAVYDSIRAIPTLRVVDYSTSADKHMVTSDGRTTFGLVYEPQPNGFVDPAKPKVYAAFNAAVKAHGLTGSITG